MKMTHSSIYWTLLFGGLLGTISPASAQISRRATPDNQKKDFNSFAEHLWYGGGFGLNFSSGLGNLEGNTFAIGISPMVGYKLNQILSIGPRFEVLYTTGRFRNNFTGRVEKYNGFDYGAGAFGRAKFLKALFAHAEVSYINRVFPTEFNGTKLETQRYGDNQFLMGLGYASGGVFKSEFLLLYDLTADSQSTNLPLVYRFGFTYNF